MVPWQFFFWMEKAQHKFPILSTAWMLQDMTATRLPWFRLFPFGYEETTWVWTGSIDFNFMFSARVGARCCLLLGLRVGVSCQMCSPVPTDLAARPDSRICLGERWVSHGRRDSRERLERLGRFRKLPDLRTDIVIFRDIPIASFCFPHATASGLGAGYCSLGDSTSAIRCDGARAARERGWSLLHRTKRPRKKVCCQFSQFDGQSVRVIQFVLALCQPEGDMLWFLLISQRIEHPNWHPDPVFSLFFVVLDVAICSISGCVATLAQTTDSKLASKGGIATRPKMEGLQQASIVSVDSRYSRWFYTT